MEAMVKQVCIDSDILIGLLNGDDAARERIASLDADFFTTAVNSFELWYGRKSNEPVFELLEWLTVLSMDDRAGRLAADIMRALKKRGQLLDLRDVFIAAICITNGLELLTNNRQHFARMSGFGLVLA